MNPDLGLSILGDPAAIISLHFGAVIVALNSMKTFAEPTLESGEDEFVVQLLPKYLATREEYSRALFWYMASMVGVLCALSLLGPRLFNALPAMDQFKQAAPLGFALILIGLLPSVPWLRDLEWRVRHFWHNRAYIPAAARATADTLRASDFNFSAYKSEDVLDSALMRGVEPMDFNAPRGTIEHGWARLSCLLYELRRRLDAGEVNCLDTELLDRYQKGLDSIVIKRRALINDIAQYGQEKSHNKFYDSTQLGRDITDALRQLYILLGCAARLKAGRTLDVNATFRSFGFVLEALASPPENQDLILVGLAVMGGSLFALVSAAFVAGSLLDGIWETSPHFPKDAVKPFIWALSSLVQCCRRHSRLDSFASDSTKSLVFDCGTATSTARGKLYTRRIGLHDNRICCALCLELHFPSCDYRTRKGNSCLRAISGSNRSFLCLSSRQRRINDTAAKMDRDWLAISCHGALWLGVNACLACADWQSRRQLRFCRIGDLVWRGNGGFARVVFSTSGGSWSLRSANESKGGAARNTPDCRLETIWI